MPERRILITRRDFLQDAAATISGGIWTQPIANVLDPRPQFVAEAATSADVAATKFDADLGYQRTVGLFFFANLRLTSLSFLRLRASLASDLSSPTYDTGIVSGWPQDSTAGGIDAWGNWTLNGVYNSAEYVRLGMTRVFIPPAPIACRYIRVEVMDTTAALPLQIGCFGACEVWQPPINFNYGWQITPMDESGVDLVPAGSSYVNQRGMRRRLNLGFPHLPEDELWARAFGLVLAKGSSEPLVVVPFPDRVTQIEKQAVYGRIITASQISNPYFQRYAVPFQIDQDI